MIMDIAVIVIFVLTIFLSMRKGFIFTVASFFKGIASIVVAYLLCGPAGTLVENTQVGEATKLRISEHLTAKWQESDMYTALPAIFRDGADSMSEDVIARTSESINHIAWLVLSFIVILIVIRIVIGLLVGMTKKSREKEGFTGTLDWFLGLILGIIIGLFAVFLVLALLFPVASLVAPGHAQDIMAWFNGSIFAQDLYDNNLLLLMFANIFI